MAETQYVGRGGTTTALRVSAVLYPNTDWGLSTAGPCASGEWGASAEARFPPTSDGRDNHRYLGRGRGLLQRCLHSTSHVNQWWLLCMKDFTPILRGGVQLKTFKFRNVWMFFCCLIYTIYTIPCGGPWNHDEVPRMQIAIFLSKLLTDNCTL